MVYMVVYAKSTLHCRLEEIIPKILTHYSILLFLMNLPIIPKTATQCDHLNAENTIYCFCNIHTMAVFILGVPRLVNILELNMNSGLQANFLSTHSATQ